MQFSAMDALQNSLTECWLARMQMEKAIRERDEEIARLEARVKELEGSK